MSDTKNKKAILDSIEKIQASELKIAETISQDDNNIIPFVNDKKNSQESVNSFKYKKESEEYDEENHNVKKAKIKHDIILGPWKKEQSDIFLYEEFKNRCDAAKDWLLISHIQAQEKNILKRAKRVN